MVKENCEFKISDDLVLKSGDTKNKIILTNTQHPINDFLIKIKLRYNKKYDKVPAYTIDRFGTLFFHFNPGDKTNFFEDYKINDTAIVVSLENVGWLDYIEQKKVYIDWRGVKYNNTVIEKTWRHKKYWAEYTNEQMDTLLQLIDYLCIEYSINKEFIGSNVFINDAHKFKGVLSRSNFNKNYHDLSPAFDFEKLTKKLKK